MIHSELYSGAAALALMNDAAFADEWTMLLTQCSWATPFQKPEFAMSYFAAYSNTVLPLITTVRSSDRELLGLFVGAHSAGGLIAVGGVQAEYPCWLFAEGHAATVFDETIDVVEAKFGRTGLTLRYLPSAFPIDEFYARTRHKSRILARNCPRPVMKISSSSAEESLRKKSNKSKLNRLGRLGKVEFEVVDTVDRFDAILDTVIEQYDARQQQKNNVAPFAGDANKRKFHIEMMRHGLLHVSVLTLDGRIISSHLGAKGARKIHLSIVSYDETLAEHSPNKFLLLMLAKRLASDGYEMLDLTPSGSTWKWRFATDTDEVVELQMFASTFRCAVEATNRHLRRTAKNILKYLQRASGKPTESSDSAVPD